MFRIQQCGEMPTLPFCFIYPQFVKRQATRAKMTYQNILLQVRQRIARLARNRPGQRNSFAAEIHGELHGTLRAAGSIRGIGWT